MYLRDHLTCNDIVFPNATEITDVSLQYLNFLRKKENIDFFKKWSDKTVDLHRIESPSDGPKLHQITSVVMYFESLQKRVRMYIMTNVHTQTTKRERGQIV